MIKSKLKKIFKLSKIFLEDSFQNIDIFNKDTQKINKKSIFLWMILILIFTLFFLSEKIVKFLVARGQAEIFLNLYFLILSILFLFQTVLVCANIFYFSKDLEFILPLPIKPEELLVSKFITLICKIYISEIIFGVIPIIIYGIYTNASLLFYIYLIIIFFIFPIFFSLAISIIMMFVMKISKYIRNKDVFQIIVTLLLITVLVFIEYKTTKNIFVQNNSLQNVSEEQILEKVLDISNRMKVSNKYFLVINPSIDVLKNANLISILDIIKIIFIDIVAFIIFLFIGKKTYLKDILKNNISLTNKKYRKNNLHKRCKKRNESISYINKEFKSLFRNPMFFIQCIYPVLISIITIIIMSIIIAPRLQEVLSNEELRKQIGDISFDISSIYIILALIQFLFMMSTVSLTGFSREGKNVIFVKYIPITYYKQFIYKSIPQIFINFISIFAVIGIIHFSIPSIECEYLMCIFILATLLNVINSLIMLMVDLLNPKLEWDTEYAVLKQNNNKIIQYVFTIFIMILLIYFNKIFRNIDINFAIILTAVIFLSIIILINIFIRIKQEKLFKRIN